MSIFGELVGNVERAKSLINAREYVVMVSS
jgi:hypothetical protein